MHNRDLGAYGEKIASDYLAKKGFNILEKNYRKRTGEIDIIAFDPMRHEYVFAEVKTRRGNAFGYPEEAINPKKIKKISLTAEIWKKEKNISSTDWRIDIISIELKNGNPSVTYLENIY